MNNRAPCPVGASWGTRYKAQSGGGKSGDRGQGTGDTDTDRKVWIPEEAEVYVWFVFKSLGLNPLCKAFPPANGI